MQPLDPPAKHSVSTTAAQGSFFESLASRELTKAHNQPTQNDGLSDNSALQAIFDQGLIWRACDQREDTRSIGIVKSGFDSLDAHLHRGGWPSGEGLELLSKFAGSESHLILPVLAALTGAGYAVALINAPFQMLPHGLLQHGGDSTNLYFVQTKQASELVYASSECAASGYFAATICWDTFQGSCLNTTQLRKCYLAANNSKGLFFLCRQHKNITQPSPARFRATLGFNELGFEVSIIKQRGLKETLAINLPIPSDLYKQLPLNSPYPYFSRTKTRIKSHTPKKRELPQEKIDLDIPGVVLPFEISDETQD